MALWFRKKPLREVIVEVEQEILQKEKELKRLKKNKESAGDLFFKIVSVVIIGGVSVIWVCKESMSYSYLLKILCWFITAGILTGLLYYGNQKISNYRINRKLIALEALREKQRKNIESLKKETKYEETHGIIKRYSRQSTPEEEVPEEKKKESMVDKIVKLL